MVFLLPSSSSQKHHYRAGFHRLMPTTGRSTLMKPTTVRELVLYRYAQLIADAAVDHREDRDPPRRLGSAYWGFVWRTYRKLLSDSISPSTVLRENKLLLSQGMECAYCGATGTLQWDHIIPLSMGGPDTIDNLVRACRTCNSRKGVQDVYTFCGETSRNVPRLVMGKYLKLVLAEHERRGTLEFSCCPGTTQLRTCDLGLVFSLPDPLQTTRPKGGE